MAVIIIGLGVTAPGLVFLIHHLAVEVFALFRAQFILCVIDFMLLGEVTFHVHGEFLIVQFFGFLDSKICVCLLGDTSA